MADFLYIYAMLKWMKKENGKGMCTRTEVDVTENG